MSEIVADPEERAFVEPRLQHLLGLTDRVAPDREDLFSAWRLFIERMADQNPVIMVFEDMHWADAALVEFVEYLLDWSRGHPIYVVTLARPEVSERHAGWGANSNFTSVTLDRLPDETIDELLRGLVPGLPDDEVERVRERADGTPLYAVETVRMLLDRGLLEPGENGYRVVGDLATLDVPETLHALIAARLDGWSRPSGSSCRTPRCSARPLLRAGSLRSEGWTKARWRPCSSLVRKEMLVLDSDPRSPERGQYGFLQALVQRVAYETPSRRGRKAKHLAAAAYLWRLRHRRRRDRRGDRHPSAGRAPIGPRRRGRRRDRRARETGSCAQPSERRRSRRLTMRSGRSRAQWCSPTSRSNARICSSVQASSRGPPTDRTRPSSTCEPRSRCATRSVRHTIERASRPPSA